MGINPRAVRVSASDRAAALAHTNFMGSVAYDVSNPLVQLRMCAASSFFGEPVYYSETESKRSTSNASRFIDVLTETLGASGKMARWSKLGAAERMEQAIDEALAFDVKGTLEIATALRQEDHIRTTPQVILVRAANHASARGTGLVREYMPKIARRTDDVVTQFAYQMELFGKKVPNSLKRGWADYLSAQNEYSLAKYRMENRKYKLVDTLYFAHAKSDAIAKLMNGTLSLGNDKTWEAMISAKGSSKETWTQAIDVMGHMALLRNLNNFIKHGVDTKAYLPKLIETAAKGQQLPFRYFSAFTAVGASAPSVVKDALETCLEESLGNLPMFSGRVMSLCDNSGSAQGAMTSSMGSVQVNHIANLTAVLTARRSEDGHVGVFGDKLQTFSVGKKSSVFTEVEKANTMGQGIGQSTEHGVWLFWDKAIKNKEHWDHVFVYSDMQAGHGGLYGTGGYDAYRWQNGRHIDVPKLIAEYRRTVNPNVHVYLVQVAGYRDTLVPEVYAKTHILGGWGDGILRYAARMAELEGGAVQTAPVLQIAPPAAVVASPIVATKKRVRKSI